MTASTSAATLTDVETSTSTTRTRGGETLEAGTWTVLLDELEDAVGGLRQRLDARDPRTGISAADRLAIERALDRYAAASDDVTRHVDTILRRTAPPPRR